MRAAVGPIETIVSVAKVKVSRPGWPGCCCSYETGCGPYRNHCFSCKSEGFQGWWSGCLFPGGFVHEGPTRSTLRGGWRIPLLLVALVRQGSSRNLGFGQQQVDGSGRTGADTLLLAGAVGKGCAFLLHLLHFPSFKLCMLRYWV